MKFVIVCSMFKLSFVFSATIPDWDNGNVDLPEPFEFETVKDIMSYLENNYLNNKENSYRNFVTTTSRPVDDFNQVFHLSTHETFLISNH